MPNQRSNAGRSMANAKRVRLVRSNETSAEQNDRLSQHREKNRNLRNVKCMV